jgi:hypothetical protein
MLFQNVPLLRKSHATLQRNNHATLQRNNHATLQCNNHATSKIILNCTWAGVTFMLFQNVPFKKKPRNLATQQSRNLAT